MNLVHRLGGPGGLHPGIPIHSHPKEAVMLRRLSLPGFLLAAALAFVAAPDSQLSASECGGPGGQLCKENESCAGFIFYRQCTTTYDYWN
jgi:hypothetical protein